MQKFKYYQGFYLAFFSKEFYQDVATSWKGIAFSYLFLLVLFSSIPLFFGYMLLTKHYLDDFRKVLDKVQRVEIVNGNFKFTTPSPYYIYDPESPKRILAVISPVKQKNLKSPGEQPHPVFFIEPNRVIIYNSASDDNVYYDFPEQDMVVTQQDLVRSSWTPVIVIPFLLLLLSTLGLFLSRIIQALVYSIVGMGLFKRHHWHAHLDYRATLRITVTALTPVTIISSIMEIISLFSPTFYPYEFWISALFIVVTFYYLHFAFKANRKEIAPIPMEPTLTTDENKDA